MSALSIEQYLIDHPELTRGDATKTMNRLIDPEWYFRFKGSSETQIDETLNFAEYFGALSPEREVWLKQCFNPSLVTLPFTTQKSGLIVASKDALGDVRVILKKIDLALKNMNQTTLSALNSQQVQLLIEDVLTTNLWHGSASTEFPSYATVKSSYMRLRRLKEAFSLGLLIDGFTTIPTLEELLGEIRDKIGPKFLGDDFDFPTWKKGSKYDGLPVTQSIALLMGCLNFFDSHKVRQVIGLSIIESQVFTSKEPRAKAMASGKCLDMNKGPSPRWASKWEKSRPQIEAAFAVAYGVESFDKIPAEAHDKIDWERSDWATIRQAIPSLAGLTVALLCGARRNELESLNWGDVYQDDQGNWKFKSDINKTNQGLSTVRYIAGKAAEIINIWKELAKTKNPELMGQMFMWNAAVGDGEGAQPGVNKMNAQSANLVIRTAIDHFINPHLDDDLKIHNFNIHSVRHAWAEFAMRRFDGTIVPELVRMHYRHHWGSYMKDRYLMGKQFEDDGVAVSQRYAAELIGRHINADLNLYGPVADFIGKRIEEMKFVNQGDLSEEDIDLIADEFQSQLEPHEYGYCLTRPATITQAKCYNKDTGLAETDKAQWDKCGSCPNRLTLPEHVHDLRRLGVSLKGTYEYWKARGIDKAADRWKSLLKMTLQQIEAIEEGNPELIPVVCETESKEAEHV